MYLLAPLKWVPLISTARVTLCLASVAEQSTWKSWHAHVVQCYRELTRGEGRIICRGNCEHTDGRDGVMYTLMHSFLKGYLLGWNSGCARGGVIGGVGMSPACNSVITTIKFNDVWRWAEIFPLVSSWLLVTWRKIASVIYSPSRAGTTNIVVALISHLVGWVYRSHEGHWTMTRMMPWRNACFSSAKHYAHRLL